MELEFFMKCEIHSSDVDVFLNSLKRVAEDVRPVQEEKGKANIFYIIYLYYLSIITKICLLMCILLFNVLVPWFPRKINDLDKCNLLITKYDPDMDQDHPVSIIFPV